MTLTELRDGAESGRFLPGSAILTTKTSIPLLSLALDPLIRKVQKDALKLSSVYRGKLSEASFIHVDVLLGPTMCGGMRFPHAGVTKLKDLDGSDFKVVVPRNASKDQLREVVDACHDDIFVNAPYSLRELVWYFLKYFRYASNLRDLAERFKSEKYDVCSSRYIRYCHTADLLCGEIPEMWYPARMAADEELFETVP